MNWPALRLLSWQVCMLGFDWLVLDGRYLGHLLVRALG